MESGFTCTDSLATRISNAKQYLLENPTETKISAALKFEVNVNTLGSSIRRQKIPNRRRGGQNKILEEHETRAVHAFIESLLSNCIEPTHSLVFDAIKALRRARNADAKDPTARWFRGWWKDNHLHAIITAGQASDVVRCITDKERIADLKEKEKARENDLKIWRKERDEVLRKGVDARKDEAIRVKKIKDLIKQKAHIPIELTIPIIDPEVEWKASDVTWKEIEAEKAKKKEKDK